MLRAYTSEDCVAFLTLHWKAADGVFQGQHQTLSNGKVARVEYCQFEILASCCAKEVRPLLKVPDINISRAEKHVNTAVRLISFSDSMVAESNISAGGFQPDYPTEKASFHSYLI